MGARKYFLDWLRVCAFALLILFHVGCLYATWDYNIKSPRLLPAIDGLLLALTPWRIALLFVISGVASRFLLAKLGAGRFALDRARRLVPVILVGTFVVIPPQTYVMLLNKGLVHVGYGHFWIFSYLAADQSLVAPLHRTMPTYDHLWFVVYLLVYTLIFAAAARLLRRFSLPRLPLWLLLSAPALWLIVSNFLIERVFPATWYVANDWGSHLKWAGLFVAGIMCAPREDVWAWLGQHRVKLITAALLFLALQSVCHAIWLNGRGDPLTNAAGWAVTTSLYAWAMIGALCGYAQTYLNESSALLARLNEAILPVYVLHQPILLISAYLIFPLRWPLPLETAALAGITGFGAFAIYETAIRPFALMRILFGLKPEKFNAPGADDGIDELATSSK